MGTRGLTKVIDENGILKVAQYGQWDHYPSGQGINILSIISEYNALENIRWGLKRTYFLTNPQHDKLIAKTDWQDKDSVDLFKIMYPTLTRDLGSDVLLSIIYSTGKVPLRNESDFEEEDLWCEGIYTINYQTKEFITKWRGKTTSYPLYSLPSKDVYLIDTEHLTAAA